MRLLENEARPLLDAVDPLTTLRWDKTVDSEVLWETRMVDAGEIVGKALAEARSEVGAWAVCADVAAELRSLGHADAAGAFAIASAELEGETGLRCGASALRRVREAIDNPEGTDGVWMAGSTERGAAQGLCQGLCQDAARWLRCLLGAGVIFLDAAHHRVRDGPDDKKVCAALETVSQCFHGEKDASICGEVAGVRFREACACTSDLQLLTLLHQLEKETAQVLGAGWAVERMPAVLLSTPPPAGAMAVNEACLTDQGHRFADCSKDHESCSKRSCCCIV